MPYIDQRSRDMLGGYLETAQVPDSPGELNYVLTAIVCDYVFQNGGLSYQRINDVLGALEGAKLEFYRRVATPYEDTKIELNGDVHTGLI